MIDLIVGPDAAAAHAAAAKLLAEHDPDGSNTSRLDGREVSPADVASAIGSLGFFGGRRVVLVRGLMTRAARSRPGAAEHDETDEPTSRPGALDLGPLLAAVPEQNLLILLDPELAAVPAAVKRAAPASARVAAFDPPRGRALVEWLRRVAHDAGGEMAPEAAKLLAERLYPQSWANKPTNPRYDRPPDTILLRNEVEKLVLAADPDPVRREHVVALTPGAADDRLFRFLEAAGAGPSRLQAALVELERLLDAGEEPAKLGAQLAQQVELAALLDAAPGKDPVAIGRDLGLANPARMSGIAGGRRGAVATVGTAIAATLAADRGLKRGRLRQPTDALYEQVLASALGGKRSGGGTLGAAPAHPSPR